MMKFYKFFEYAYLVVAVFFTYQAIVSWADQRGRAIMFAAFVVVAIFMYFFKRRFRKKIEQHKEK